MLLVWEDPIASYSNEPKFSRASVNCQRSLWRKGNSLKSFSRRTIAKEFFIYS